MKDAVYGQHAADCALRVTLAVTFRQRLRGLLRTTAQDDEVLLLTPCRSIHTYGMRYALDVAFVDERGVVVLSARNVVAGKKISCRQAVAVLERAATPSRAWLCVGQALMLLPKRPRGT